MHQILPVKAFKPKLQVRRMKKYSFIIYISIVFRGISCRSFKQLTAKDHNSTGTVAKRSKKVGNPTFIEGIEVTPGVKVSSKHKTSTVNTKTADRKNTTTSSTSNSLFTVENASFLQLKYSVLIGVPINYLTNLALLELMDKWWGTKYCMGGTTENCLDCSAFTQLMYRDLFTFVLPRTAQEQYNTSEIIGAEDLKEGDLVFFHTSSRNKKSINHVGFYLQNNKFVHAATSGGVMISDLNEHYWSPKFKGGGRVKQ